MHVQVSQCLQDYITVQEVAQMLSMDRGQQGRVKDQTSKEGMEYADVERDHIRGSKTMHARAATRQPGLTRANQLTS